MPAPVAYRPSAARLSPSPGLARSGHPGGLARPAPPQPLQRRERALVQRLERPGSPQNRHSGPPSARASIHPDTWHRPGSRPTCGCAPHDTGPSRCSSTPTSSSTATASCCSTPARTGRRSPTRATSPAAPPNPLRPPRRALRHRPRRYAHRPAGGHRRAAGVRTPPGGTDLALGPSATLPRRGFRWPPAEQPAPPRASGRLHRGRA